MDVANQLSQLLSQYLHQSQQLCELLERENEALSDDDAEQIQATAEEKQVLLDEFAKSDKRLMAILANAGVSQEPQVMEKLLAQCPADQQQQLTQLWQDLSPTLEKCRSQNIINGTIIASRLNGIRRTIDIVRNGGEAGTVSYDASGAVVTGKGSRTDTII